MKHIQDSGTHKSTSPSDMEAVLVGMDKQYDVQQQWSY